MFWQVLYGSIQLRAPLPSLQAYAKKQPGQHDVYSLGDDPVDSLLEDRHVVLHLVRLSAGSPKGTKKVLGMQRTRRKNRKQKT